MFICLLKTIKMILTDKQIQILQGKICPYCGKETEYIDSNKIYGRDYGMLYFCQPCYAYCGVHKGTDNSLGRLANKELRYWKKQAHKYFDVIWKSGNIKRNEAYKELSKHLQIPSEYCHIGMFSVNTCKKVVEWSKQQVKTF
jgi:hypothetical protein